jgi:HDOD domain
MFQPGAPSKTHRASGNGRLFVVAKTVRSRHFFAQQPPVPVPPVTRLQIDLLLNRSVLDLQAIVDVILADVGAALQVLRISAPIRTIADRRTGHIETCVLHLGRTGLRRALSVLPPSGFEGPNETTKSFWLRSQIAAELARMLAKGRADISPNDAALAGLLHEIGRLPQLLGWRVPGIDLSNTIAVGSALAEEWRLPFFEKPSGHLAESGECKPCPMAGIVTAASDMAIAIVPPKASLLVNQTHGLSHRESPQWSTHSNLGEVLISIVDQKVVASGHMPLRRR